VTLFLVEHPNPSSDHFPSRLPSTQINSCQSTFDSASTKLQSCPSAASQHRFNQSTGSSQTCQTIHNLRIPIRNPQSAISNQQFRNPTPHQKNTSNVPARSHTAPLSNTREHTSTSARSPTQFKHPGDSFHKPDRSRHNWSDRPQLFHLKLPQPDLPMPRNRVNHTPERTLPKMNVGHLPAVEQKYQTSLP
jgi:hypothetical protein